jgi:competence protein ComEC
MAVSATRPRRRSRLDSFLAINPTEGRPIMEAASSMPPAPVENIWRAPLVPVALAATAGIVLDRFALVPLAVSLVTLLLCLLAWAIARLGRSAGLPLVYLAGAIAAFGAAYHHAHRESYPADDIGHFATEEAQPIRLRGRLAETPGKPVKAGDDALRSLPQQEMTRTVLRVTQLRQRDAWLPVSGQVLLRVGGPLRGQVGDEVEVVGRLQAPRAALNPGEFDQASWLRDRRIRAELVVQAAPAAVVHLGHSQRWSLVDGLAAIRAWGKEQLQDRLAPRQSGLAAALLLGDDSALPAAEWDKYARTGVIHVLAISGQHLMILSAALWFVLRLAGVRRRRGAIAVALLLLAYALLTGGRPPVLRSAVMVLVICGGLVLRRPVLAVNAFALGWLIVAAINPTDLFTAGCQLSFLSAALLYWGTSRWLVDQPYAGSAPWLRPRNPVDPLERLAEASRPRWQRLGRRLGRIIALSYGVSLILWLGLAPLVAARQNLISPVGPLLTPPAIVLASIGLIAGFLLLLTTPLGPVAIPFALLTDLSLAGCDALVDLGDRLPGAYWYVGAAPAWWLVAFYAGLLGVMLLPSLQQRWRWVGVAGLGWLCVGLVGGSAPVGAGEFRCTFLAVGHGGCTVLELPDGRTLLYDAGALNGPEVARWQIAPFLWQRGIRRIDEVILSHADLDHFNGLPALLERFAVGQVTCTPTFVDKATPAVRATLAALERGRIPVRIVRAGDRLGAGAVDMAVLHPPAAGPPGNENARSLVLRVRHGGHAILLTGDLEGPGLERLLQLPSQKMDVLMAPHHGSKAANPAALAAWARPRVVVACQGPVEPGRGPNPYDQQGARYLGTWPHGAVTVQSGPAGLSLATFRTGLRWQGP